MGPQHEDSRGATGDVHPPTAASVTAPPLEASAASRPAAEDPEAVSVPSGSTTEAPDLKQEDTYSRKRRTASGHDSEDVAVHGSNKKSRVEFKLNVDVLEELECPVCFETPRDGPIYNCLNGHVICKECEPKVPHCPTCRDEILQCRNLFAEKVLKDQLRFRELDCRSAIHGCKFRGLLDMVKVHEESCGHNQVTCVRRHARKSICLWVGSFQHLGSHLMEHRCLALNVLQHGSTKHTATLGDYPDKSVFNTNELIEWRPSLLYSKNHEYSLLFPHLLIGRDGDKGWHLYVRAFAGPSLRDRWRVRITVKRPEKEAKAAGVDPDDAPQWSYFGKMNGHEQEEEEVKESCRLLKLEDWMVKKLKVGKSLLHYSVEFVAQS